MTPTRNADGFRTEARLLARNLSTTTAASGSGSAARSWRTLGSSAFASIRPASTAPCSRAARAGGRLLLPNIQYAYTAVLLGRRRRAKACRERFLLLPRPASRDRFEVGAVFTQPNNKSSTAAIPGLPRALLAQGQPRPDAAVAGVAGGARRDALGPFPCRVVPPLETMWRTTVVPLGASDSRAAKIVDRAAEHLYFSLRCLRNPTTIRALQL